MSACIKYQTGNDKKGGGWKKEEEEKWTPLEALKEVVLMMMKSVTLFYKMQDKKKTLQYLKINMPCVRIHQQIKFDMKIFEHFIYSP